MATRCHVSGTDASLLRAMSLHIHRIYVRSLNISSIVSAIPAKSRNGIFTGEISYLNFETIIIETKPRLNVFSTEKNARSSNLIYGEHILRALNLAFDQC